MMKAANFINANIAAASNSYLEDVIVGKGVVRTCLIASWLLFLLKEHKNILPS